MHLFATFGLLELGLTVISGTPFRLVFDIDDEWPLIGSLVVGVDPSDNAGDDLRHECQEGRALCLISDDALLVVNLQGDRYGSGDLELFVRMAVARGEKGSIQRNDAHLDSIARDMGAKRIVFNTMRRGMRKVLGPAWTIRHIVFERAVHG
jgi:hypothetical protein